MTSVPDLLRLLAVPAFAWIALRDYRTRRIPNRTWYPLVAVGAVALAWEALLVFDRSGFAVELFVLQVGVSLGLLVPLGYGLYRLGGFGGADAKAFMTLAIVYPTFPIYRVAGLVFPLVRPPVSAFSLTIVTDAVLIGALYPVALAVRNALAGRVSVVTFLGRPIPWTALARTHGKLLETAAGFTRRGLDLDALRMYLRWRGISLSDVREHPDYYRDPATLPAEPNPPTDGAVDPDEDLNSLTDTAPDGVSSADSNPENTPSADDPERFDDPWGAAAFLDDVGAAYGTTPGTLRAGLDHVAAEDVVWVSPGIPFLLPLFFGLLLALAYGDVLYTVLEAIGFV